MAKRVSAVFVTDLHLDKNNVALVSDIMRQAFDLCFRVDTDTLIIGGDVFTARSGQPLACLIAWRNVLEHARKNGIRVIAIPGNHDKTDPNSNDSYLDVYPRELMSVERRGDVWALAGGVNAVMIPYWGDTDKWRTIYEALYERVAGAGQPNVVITHMGFDGVRNLDGSLVSNNLRPGELFGGERDIRTVLVGHYHNASVLGAERRVIYTGSAYQCNYGEDVTPKGFTVIYNDGSVEHVQSTFPRYVKHVIGVRDAETLANLLETLDPSSSDHVRLEFRGPRAEAGSVPARDLESRYGVECRYVATDEIETTDPATGAPTAVLLYDKAAVRRDFVCFCAENEIRGTRLKYGMDLIKTL